MERIPNWGAGIHELTPVGPAGVGPDNWLGPPGVSGVVEYFIQFAERPYRIDLLKVNWQWCNNSGPLPGPPPPSISYTVIGAGSAEFNGNYTAAEGESLYRQDANQSLALYTEKGMWRLAIMGTELMYVQALDWPRAQPPLSGWSVAQHCNVSAGIRPPSCTMGCVPTGGQPPAPRLEVVQATP